MQVHEVFVSVSWLFYVVIFGVDHSSSFHPGNRRNKFLVLDEGPTYGINGSFGSPEKST